MVLFSALIKALMQQLLNRRFTKSYDVIIVLWELLKKNIRFCDQSVFIKPFSTDNNHIKLHKYYYFVLWTHTYKNTIQQLKIYNVLIYIYIHLIC